MDIATWRGIRCVKVCMRINPQHPCGLLVGGATNRSNGDGMVTAHDQGHATVCYGLPDGCIHQQANRAYCSCEHCAVHRRIQHCAYGHLHVSDILNLMSELLQPLHQACIAQRTGSNVDPAQVLPEIHWRADTSNFVRHRRNGWSLNCKGLTLDSDITDMI